MRGRSNPMWGRSSRDIFIWRCPRKKTLITHGSDFAHFLGYLITVSREQNSTRTKTGFTRRTYVGKVKLYVPKEKWLNRLLSYGALKISYDKTHGNKEVWEPVRRPGLIRLDDIEILNQYQCRSAGHVQLLSAGKQCNGVELFPLRDEVQHVHRPSPESIGRACGKLFANTAATGILLYRIQRKTGQNLWCFTIRACVITTKSL